MKEKKNAELKDVNQNLQIAEIVELKNMNEGFFFENVKFDCFPGNSICTYKICMCTSSGVTKQGNGLRNVPSLKKRA